MVQNAIMAPADELRRQIRAWALRSGVDLRAVAQVCKTCPKNTLCPHAQHPDCERSFHASQATIICRTAEHRTNLRQQHIEHVLTSTVH